LESGIKLHHKKRERVKSLVTLLEQGVDRARCSMLTYHHVSSTPETSNKTALKEKVRRKR
jgi:hypothetical protein